MTIPTTVIERAAKALILAQFPREHGGDVLAEQAAANDWPIWQTAVNNARTVLQSLLPPSDEMGRVSALVHKCGCGRRITMWGVNALPAMIQSALNPKGKNDG